MKSKFIQYLEESDKNIVPLNESGFLVNYILNGKAASFKFPTWEEASQYIQKLMGNPDGISNLRMNQA